MTMKPRHLSEALLPMQGTEIAGKYTLYIMLTPAPPGLGSDRFKTLWLLVPVFVA